MISCIVSSFLISLLYMRQNKDRSEQLVIQSENRILLREKIAITQKMRTSFLIAITSSNACPLVISLVLVLNGVFSSATYFNSLNKVHGVFLKAFYFYLLNNDANSKCNYTRFILCTWEQGNMIPLS